MRRESSHRNKCLRAAAATSGIIEQWQQVDREVLETPAKRRRSLFAASTGFILQGKRHYSIPPLLEPPRPALLARTKSD